MDAKELEKYIVNGRLFVKVTPNSPQTEIIGYDQNKKALRINVAAVPDKDKANKELVKFLSKKFKKKITIISGKTSREKLLRVE